MKRQLLHLMKRQLLHLMKRQLLHLMKRQLLHLMKRIATQISMQISPIQLWFRILLQQVMQPLLSETAQYDVLCNYRERTREHYSSCYITEYRWPTTDLVPLYYAPTSGLITTGSGTADGNFTSANFVDGLKGKPMSDLVKKILDGEIYLAIKTVDFPLGEIAGKTCTTK